MEQDLKDKIAELKPIIQEKLNIIQSNEKEKGHCCAACKNKCHNKNQMAEVIEINDQKEI
jgi:hypothetical protein